MQETFMPKKQPISILRETNIVTNLSIDSSGTSIYTAGNQGHSVAAVKFLY